MRLWSLHPAYLDPRGLVALWREALLAQAVLRGATRGYRAHPQLIRFREQRSPLGSIAQYLRDVHAESVVRGYRFDAARIGEKQADGLIDVPRAQIEFEWGHLGRKLEARAPGWVKTMSERQRERGLPGRTEGVGADRIVPHPLFRVVEGAVEAWEVR